MRSASLQILSPIFPAIISLVIALTVGIIVFLRFRSVSSASHFIFATLLNILWLLCDALAVLLPFHGAGFLFNDIQFLLGLSISVEMLRFALNYTGKQFAHQEGSWYLIYASLLLLVTPVIAYWIFPELRTGNTISALAGGNRQEIEITWVYWAGLIFESTLLAIGMMMISTMLSRSHKKLNTPTFFLLVGFAIPFASNILKVGIYRFDLDGNITSLAFTIGYLLIAIGLIRFHVFGLKPIARDLVLEQMSDGILILDNHLRVVDYNPAAVRLLGMAEQISIGVHFQDICPFLDYQLPEQEFTLPSGSSEAPTEKILQASSTMLQDDPSHTSGYLIIVHDVTVEKKNQMDLVSLNKTMEAEIEARTQDLSDLIARLEEEIQERQQAEKSLRINEVKYRTIIEQAHESILLIDQDGVVMEGNPAFLQISGMTASQVVGKKIIDLLQYIGVSSDLTKFYSQVNKVLAELKSGKVFIPADYRDSLILARGGIERIVEFNPSVIRNEFGNMLLVVGRDVTGARQIEKALIESEERNRLIVATSPDGIILMDQDTRILAANQSQATLFGVTCADELVGLKLADFIREEDYNRILEETPDVRWISQVDKELIFTRRDGSHFIGDFRSSKIRSDESQQADIVVIIRDITLRKQVEQDLIRLNRSLKVISECNQVILRESDEETLLTEICRVIVEQGGYQFAWISLASDHPDRLLHLDAYFCDRFTDIEAENLICSYEWQQHPDVVRLFRSYDPLVIEDFRAYFPSSACLASLQKIGTRRIFILPLDRCGTYYGVLVIYSSANDTPADTDLLLLRELTDDLSYGIQTLRTREERDKVLELLEKSNYDLSLAYDFTLEGWSHALELRERETAGHSKRVVDLTIQLASQMGIPIEDLIHIRRGALLHDIGKMAIPDSILLKEGTLTEEEWQIMRQHPVYSYQLLVDIPYLKPALDIPRWHHERWDGSGYPDGLQGEDIPLAARIFAIVDVWDALNSNRPYRLAWNPPDVLSYIIGLSGRQFDPRVVDTFTAMILSEPEKYKIG